MHKIMLQRLLQDWYITTQCKHNLRLSLSRQANICTIDFKLDSYFVFAFIILITYCYGIYVGLMASKCLLAHTITNVPQLKISR